MNFFFDSRFILIFFSNVYYCNKSVNLTHNYIYFLVVLIVPLYIIGTDRNYDKAFIIFTFAQLTFRLKRRLYAYFYISAINNKK